MRALQGIRVEIVMLAGVFATLNSGAGFMIQAQQLAAPAPSNKTPAMDKASQPEQDPQGKTTDQKAAPPATERQKKLAADTDKLLELAKQLKEQVDKTNKDVLSVQVVKKAEEIEKLARNMKGEMK
jgi:hypothetical protein